MIFRWSTVFRPFPKLRQTALAMVDPRPGDVILFVGAADAALAGECGAVAGLNGRTVVVDEQAAAARSVERAAAEAGALVEFVPAPATPLPFDTGTFGLIVVPGFASWLADDRLTRLAEIFRVAQPGARLVLLAAGKHGWFSSGTSAAPTLEEVLHLFTRLGGVAGRKLAEADGVTYYEVRKPR